MVARACTVRTRLAIPVVFCLIMLAPSAADACYYEAGLYADLYDNGVDYVETYGAGWDSSVCPGCGHFYQLQATLWFNSVEVNADTFNDMEGALGYTTLVGGWVSHEVIFGIYCECGGPIEAGYAAGSQQVQRPPIPTGETNILFNWQGGGGTSQWWQNLLPSTVSFDGRTVKEFTGAGAVDNCYSQVPNSARPPLVALTGGEWPVEGIENLWGPDNIAWAQEDINYYRAQGVTPCSATIPQSMRINVGSGWVEYVIHNLIYTIGDTTVTYKRGTAQEQSKTWP